MGRDGWSEVTDRRAEVLDGMCHISGRGVNATCLAASPACCDGNGEAGGRALATRPKRTTRKYYQIGNDRWVPDVLISGPVVFLCRPVNTYSVRWTKAVGGVCAGCTRGVGECALEMSGRGIISSGPGEPVALLYEVLDRTRGANF